MRLFSTRYFSTREGAKLIAVFAVNFAVFARPLQFLLIRTFVCSRCPLWRFASNIPTALQITVSVAYLQNAIPTRVRRASEKRGFRRKSRNCGKAVTFALDNGEKEKGDRGWDAEGGRRIKLTNSRRPSYWVFRSKKRGWLRSYVIPQREIPARPDRTATKK